MSKNQEQLSFYRKMAELQEKLRKSEEERAYLESQFHVLVNNGRAADEARLASLRRKYVKFLEDDKRRKSRNEKIIAALEKIEKHTVTLTAKTERLRVLRSHFDTYMARTYPEWKDNIKRSNEYMAPLPKNYPAAAAENIKPRKYTVPDSMAKESQAFKELMKDKFKLNTPQFNEIEPVTEFNTSKDLLSISLNEIGENSISNSENEDVIIKKLTRISSLESPPPPPEISVPEISYLPEKDYAKFENIYSKSETKENIYKNRPESRMESEFKYPEFASKIPEVKSEMEYVTNEIVPDPLYKVNVQDLAYHHDEMFQPVPHHLLNIDDVPASPLEVQEHPEDAVMEETEFLDYLSQEKVDDGNVLHLTENFEENLDIDSDYTVSYGDDKNSASQQIHTEVILEEDIGQLEGKEREEYELNQQNFKKIIQNDHKLQENVSKEPVHEQEMKGYAVSRQEMEGKHQDSFDVHPEVVYDDGVDEVIKREVNEENYQVQNPSTVDFYTENLDSSSQERSNEGVNYRDQDYYEQQPGNDQGNYLRGQRQVSQEYYDQGDVTDPGRQVYEQQYHPQVEQGDRHAYDQGDVTDPGRQQYHPQVEQQGDRHVEQEYEAHRQQYPEQMRREYAPQYEEQMGQEYADNRPQYVEQIGQEYSDNTPQYSEQTQRQDYVENRPQYAEQTQRQDYVEDVPQYRENRPQYAEQTRQDYEENRAQYAEQMPRQDYEENRPQYAEQLARENRPQYSEQTRQDYEENRPQYVEQTRQDYEENRPQYVEQTRQDYEENRPQYVEQTRQDYEENGPQYVEETRQDYEENRPQYVEQTRQDYEENRPQYVEQTRQDYEENRPQYVEQTRQDYEENRPQYVEQTEQDTSQYSTERGEEKRENEPEIREDYSEKSPQQISGDLERFPEERPEQNLAQPSAHGMYSGAESSDTVPVEAPGAEGFRELELQHPAPQDENTDTLADLDSSEMTATLSEAKLPSDPVSQETSSEDTVEKQVAALVQPPPAPTTPTPPSTTKTRSPSNSKTLSRTPSRSDSRPSSANRSKPPSPAAKAGARFAAAAKKK